MSFPLFIHEISTLFNFIRRICTVSMKFQIFFYIDFIRKSLTSFRRLYIDKISILFTKRHLFFYVNFIDEISTKFQNRNLLPVIFFSLLLALILFLTPTKQWRFSYLQKVFWEWAVRAATILQITVIIVWFSGDWHERPWPWGVAVIRVARQENRKIQRKGCDAWRLFY